MKKMKSLFILLITTVSFSQTSFNSEGYAITRPDLTTNTFEKDSTANALVIYEFGNSYIDKRSFALITEVKKKIKILNRQGFDQSIISVLLSKSGNKKQKLKDLSGTTYNLENDEITHTKLQDNEIFEENYNEYYTLIKFTLPNIKEGSVIVFNYTIESPFIYKYKGWDFQGDIPKLHSEYNTSIPGNYEYNIKLVGLKKFDVYEDQIELYCIEVGGGASANCVKTKYVMKDIPAFINENYMTTKSNYLSRIEYELKTIKHFDGRVEHISKAWKTVDSELKNDNNIGRQLGKKTGLDHPFDKSQNDLEKAKAIYSYVQKNYTWNEEYNIFKDVSIKNLLKEKSGNVSEINMLLHNLLEENDISVMPILLSTRNNGFPTKIYPVISDFNYLINQVIIDDNAYFLDATDKYLSFGELPFRCLNEYGRVIDFKKGSYWIDIVPEKISTMQHRFELSMTSDDILKGSIGVVRNGYHALNVKKAYYENPESYLKFYKDTYPSIQFINNKVTSEDKTSYDFNEQFEIEMGTEVIGDKIYLNPFLFNNFKDNPLKLQERTYPIDFGFKDAYLYAFKIEIDDSYEILELPKDASFSLPNKKGTILLSTKVDDHTITMYHKINFNDSMYESEYYPYLKEFFSQIVDIQNNSLIVLKKK